MTREEKKKVDDFRAFLISKVGSDPLAMGRFSWEAGPSFTITKSGIDFKLLEVNDEYTMSGEIMGMPKYLLQMKGDDPEFGKKFLDALAVKYF